MNPRISLAVVGCGYWGPNLIRNLRELPQCDVAALCDVNRSRLAHFAGIYPEIPAEPDFSRLLESKALDAVVIATPIRHHFFQAKASLLAGKHTFIEKPMAATVAQCEELIAIAERNGLVLMVGHTYLFSAAVRWIHGMVRSGELGEIRAINARRLNLGLFREDVNVTWDLAPHDLAIIRHLLDETPVSVNCEGNAHVTPGIEDTTTLSLDFASGRSATIQSGWLEPRKVREMTIVGTRKMIVYNDLEPIEKVRVFDARVDCAPLNKREPRARYSYHRGDSYTPSLETEEPLRAECGHFLGCIATGAEPLTSGRSGLEIVRILEASSRSLRRNGASVPLVPARKRASLSRVSSEALRS